jgi:hypothetical protein
MAFLTKGRPSFRWPLYAHKKNAVAFHIETRHTETQLRRGAMPQES